MTLLENLMNLVRGIIIGKQFCFIYKNVNIGKNVTIFPGAVIGRPPLSSGATKKKINLKNLKSLNIGNNCIIGSNAVIYFGSTIGKNTMICDTACVRENVEIGDNSLIAQGVTINSNTKIGSSVKIMDNTHITGNCVIEDNVFIGMLVTTANDNTMGRNKEKSEDQKGPTIKNSARIGQGVCILPNVEIGENSLVGSNYTVSFDVPPNETVFNIQRRRK